MSLTVGKMQKYLEEKYKRTKPEELKNTQRYFLKLIEEVGELAEVIRKNQRMEDGNIKGTIEEELSDVLYYVLMIANTYDINLEKCFRIKEELNSIRYGHKLKIDDIFVINSSSKKYIVKIYNVDEEKQIYTTIFCISR